MFIKLIFKKIILCFNILTIQNKKLNIQNKKLFRKKNIFQIIIIKIMKK